MRDANPVYLDEAILHIVNPQGVGLVLSEVSLILADNRHLDEYLTRHISNSLQDPRTRAARFEEIGTKTPSGLCAGLLDDSIDLVQGSQELAQHLYAILEKDRRTKGAVLAVCLYRADNYPNIRFMALLKVDPSEVFRHRVSSDSRGNKYIDLELDTEAFTHESLQKCAFVQPLHPRPEYDMMLLDTQVRNRQRRDYADYFGEQFLGAMQYFDDRRRTEELYKSLVSARNQLQDELSDRERGDLDSRIQLAITSNAINIDSWLAELPLSDTGKAKLDQVVSEKLPDRQFELDPEFSQGLTKKRRFRGDYGLKVEVQTQHSNQTITSVERIEDEPSRQPFYRVTIETLKWDEIPR